MFWKAKEHVELWAQSRQNNSVVPQCCVELLRSCYVAYIILCTCLQKDINGILIIAYRLGYVILCVLKVRPSIIDVQSSNTGHGIETGVVVTTETRCSRWGKRSESTTELISVIKKVLSRPAHAREGQTDGKELFQRDRYIYVNVFCTQSEIIWSTHAQLSRVTPDNKVP